MTSAFKNFFITFAICLLVFVILGVNVLLPELLEFKLSDKDDSQPPQQDQTESSEDQSQDSTSQPDVPDLPTNIVNPEGDVFTAVVMIVDKDNRPIEIAFIDANAKTEKFIYCTIPVTTKIKTSVNTLVPIQNLFGTMTNAEILQCVTAMTGIETQYCLRFNREALINVASTKPDYYVVFDGTEGSGSGIPVTPEDKEGTTYYINNIDGRVLLTENFHGKDKIEWLLNYAPEGVELNNYNTLYSNIAKAMIRQFFEGENYTKNSIALSKIIRSCDTNLTDDKANYHMNTIFTYNKFTREELKYPASRESAIQMLRKADGSYT